MGKQYQKANITFVFVPLAFIVYSFLKIIKEGNNIELSFYLEPSVLHPEFLCESNKEHKRAFHLCDLGSCSIISQNCLWNTAKAWNKSRAVFNSLAGGHSKPQASLAIVSLNKDDLSPAFPRKAQNTLLLLVDHPKLQGLYFHINQPHLRVFLEMTRGESVPGYGFGML